MAMRYDLLAIDLDGTLLRSDRTISDTSVAAIRVAREAGLLVVICTGRGLVESRFALDRIDQRDPVIVAGGAMVMDPVTGKTIHRFNISRDVVGRAVDTLLGFGHPVLVLKDPHEAGYDYLVVEGPDGHALDPVTAWWFAQMNVRVRTVASLADDEHPDHTVRVGVCTNDEAMPPMQRALEARIGPAATIHHFPAVVDASKANGGVHILEIFDRGANKWSAIRWLADQHGIDPSRIVAIGDEINDIPMIRGAGLGVAMANAVAGVTEHADRTTRSHDEDGVALAIEQILAGRW